MHENPPWVNVKRQLVPVPSLRWPARGQVSTNTTPSTRTPSSGFTLWSTTCTLPPVSAGTACSTPPRWVVLWQNWSWMGTLKRWTWAASASDAFWPRNRCWRGTLYRGAGTEPFALLPVPNYFNSGFTLEVVISNNNIIRFDELYTARLIHINTSQLKLIVDCQY